MHPSYIVNADNITRDQLAQYLANAGVFQILDEYEEAEHYYRRRRNPDEPGDPDEREDRETNRRMAGYRLLGLIFKQARGLGWLIPLDWDPIDRVKNKAHYTLAYQRRGKKPIDRTPPKLIEFSEQAPIQDLLHLLQNQAIILQHIAPVAVAIDEQGREFKFQMHIQQEANKKRGQIPGKLYWGIEKLYDVVWVGKGGRRKKQLKYYLYDATHRKRYLKLDRGKATWTPHSQKPRDPFTPDDADPPHPAGKVIEPESNLIEQLKGFALSDKEFISKHYYPIAFLPKSWDVEDEEGKMPHQLSYEEKRALVWKEFCERLKVENGFTLFNAPIPLEVIATVEQPSLRHIDTSKINTDVRGRLPNGEDPPDPLPLDFNDKDNKYEWQGPALTRWINSQVKYQDHPDEMPESWTGGLIEACTGAGKTRLCYNAIEAVLRETKGQARISIVVPTKVLLNQWFEGVSNWFHDTDRFPVDEFPIPGGEYPIGISRHGGGNDEMAQQISIWVINTAARELPVMDRQHPHLVPIWDEDPTSDSFGKLIDGYPKHFLIVDEVHRSIAPSRRQIYNFTGTVQPYWASAQFLFADYRLGVTATIPQDPEKFDLLERLVGPVLCQYRYADALQKGNISDFTLTYLETGLTPEEQDAVDELNLRSTKQAGKVERLRKQGKLGNVQWPSGIPDYLAELWKEEQGDDPEVRKLNFLGGARARIYWSASYRLACALDLIRDKLQPTPEFPHGKKVLVFHKSIDGAAALYKALFEGLDYGRDPIRKEDVGIYHSQNPPGVNEQFLAAFKREPEDPKDLGPTIRCLVSVQSLLEGLDVPSADVAIAVAADKSQIKAIQSLGRVLRVKEGSEEKKEFWFVVVKSGGPSDKERRLLSDKEAKKLRGDAAVKFNFEHTLYNDKGEFVIDDPGTVKCNSLYPHSNEDVEELHRECGLMSYHQLQEAAVRYTEDFQRIIDEALDDEEFEDIESFLKAGTGFMTRNKLVKALEQYQKEVDKLPGDGSEAENIEISRPETIWPEWLVTKLPHLAKIHPEPSTSRFEKTNVGIMKDAMKGPLIQLFNRWQDEGLYEDPQVYKTFMHEKLLEAAAVNNIGVVFTKARMRPFGIIFEMDEGIVTLKISNTKYSIYLDAPTPPPPPPAPSPSPWGPGF
jgi:superfamily II DNA or RNA helicase